jgi:hypothetical protein
MDRSIDIDSREKDARVERGERGRDVAAPDRATEDYARLRKEIDSVARDHPTFPQFVQHLEQRGVRVVPSVQKSGRLNGLSYEVNGTRIKGSDLGRKYTPRSLEKRQGLIYDIARAGLPRSLLTVQNRLSLLLTEPLSASVPSELVTETFSHPPNV